MIDCFRVEDLVKLESVYIILLAFSAISVLSKVNIFDVLGIC